MSDIRRRNVHMFIFSDWRQVDRNKMIHYNLEDSPLRIKTNSAVGSGDVVNVYFYSSENDDAGGIFLRFGNNPKYNIRRCREMYTEFSASIPEEEQKIWKITKASNPLRIVIHCNEKEVLNAQLDSTCTNNHKKWASRWEMKVKKIKFKSETASVYYLPAEGKDNRTDPIAMHSFDA